MMTENNPMTVGDLIIKLSEFHPNTRLVTIHHYSGYSPEHVDVLDVDGQGDVCVLVLADLPAEDDDYF